MGVVVAEKPEWEAQSNSNGERFVIRTIKTEVEGGEAFGPDVVLSPGLTAQITAIQPGEPAIGPAGGPAAGAEGLANGGAPGGDDGDLLTLSAEEQRVVQDLRARDQQVRTEEKAHAAAAGDLAGAIQYEYTTGPDGVRYATGGSVPISTSNPSGDPLVAERQAARLATAANAAINPSAADQSVARSAYARSSDDEPASAPSSEAQRAERSYADAAALGQNDQRRRIALEV